MIHWPQEERRNPIQRKVGSSDVRDRNGWWRGELLTWRHHLKNEVITLQCGGSEPICDTHLSIGQIGPRGFELELYRSSCQIFLDSLYNDRTWYGDSINPLPRGVLDLKSAHRVLPQDREALGVRGEWNIVFRGEEKGTKQTTWAPLDREPHAQEEIVSQLQRNYTYLVAKDARSHSGVSDHKTGQMKCSGTTHSVWEPIPIWRPSWRFNSVGDWGG